MPSVRPATVSTDIAASTCWPFAVAKNEASGVPWCGVFIAVTLRSCGSQPRLAAGIVRVAGEAHSRASSPPVEWPSRWTGSPPLVCATISASRVARRRIDAVGRSSIA